MTTLHRGLALAAVHLLMVLSVAGKYLIDRNTLPRVWVRVVPFDPQLPIRGRYVRLGVAVQWRAGPVGEPYVRLAVENGELVAVPSKNDTGVSVSAGANGQFRLSEALAYFIPDNVPDPSIRQPGEELWAEVSVPRRGPPRPLRLGVKRDGVLTPLP